MSPRHARAEDPVETRRPEAGPEAGAHAVVVPRPRAVEPPPAAPSQTRSELRLAKRSGDRARRRRRLAASLAVVIVVAAGTGSVGYLRRLHRPHAGAPAEAVATARTQRTLLVQVRGADGNAVASALLAADPRAQQGALILVPNRVVAEVPGSGTQPYGQAVGRPEGAALSRSTLADLLGVTVDASWVLDQTAFRALVDRLGGISVDVDADIVGTRAGGSVVLVSKGAGQRLSGSQALAVLAYRAPGEDDLDALPRLQHVLVALLAKLPDGAALGRLVAGLGAGSELSDTRDATGVLDGAGRDIAADRVSYQTLPVLPIDGGVAPTYRLDVAGIAALAGGSLAGSRLPGHTGIGNRVLVLNQAGGAGLGQQIRDRIVPRGFVFVDSRNQTPFNRRQTIVVVYDTTSQTLARAHRLAAALGLPKAPVHVSPRAQNVADLFVFVGTDFRP